MRKLKQSILLIEQNKAQYNLDRQTAKISALSSRNVSKYDLLEKAAAIKRFEYSSLGKELKKQSSVSEKRIKK